MKEILKKSFLFGFVIGLVLLFTVFMHSLVYSASVGTVVEGDTLTASMWNAMVGNYTYSTSDVYTGRTWTDGKPIYRRVVELGDLSAYDNNTRRYITLGLDSLDTLVDSSVNFNGLSHYHFYFSSGNQFRYTVYGNGVLQFIASSNFGVWLQDVTVIVEYTKTTD